MRACEDGFAAFECECSDPDREPSEGLVVIDRSGRSDDELACFLLREMEEFCETALDLGIAPLVKVVGESET